MAVAPTARVDPRACIGEGVSIGEYCVIEADVVIGAGCRLEPYVYVKRWTTLGEANEISAGTVPGPDPLAAEALVERIGAEDGRGGDLVGFAERGTALQVHVGLEAAGRADYDSRLEHTVIAHAP